MSIILIWNKNMFWLLQCWIGIVLYNNDSIFFIIVMLGITALNINLWITIKCDFFINQGSPLDKTLVV